MMPLSQKAGVTSKEPRQPASETVAPSGVEGKARGFRTFAETSHLGLALRLCILPAPCGRTS